MRGRLGALYQLSIVTGVLVSYCINYMLRNAGAANWRWMFVTGVIPSALFFALLLVAPETPRYLFLSGKPQQAFTILERISGPETAEFEISEMRNSVTSKHTSWRALWQPGIRRVVMVGFWLAILVQVSGINTITDYAPAIFKSAGWKIDAALFSTFVIGVWNFAFTLIAFWAIDRHGRKPLYIIGSLGMTLALILLAAAALTGHFHGTIVLALILAYLAFFEACIGPVFWTLVPEIFPNYIHGHGHDRPRVDPVGVQCFGRPSFSIRLSPDWQGRHVRVSGGHGSGASDFHVGGRAGNQKQVIGRD